MAEAAWIGLAFAGGLVVGTWAYLLGWHARGKQDRK